VAPQVPKDKAAGVAAAATAENLNRALASSGISVRAISPPKIVDAATATEASAGGLGGAALAGIVAGVLVLLVAAGAGACYWARSRSVQHEQFTGGQEQPVTMSNAATPTNTGTPGALNGRDGPAQS